MNIVFMGTPEFAQIILQKISNHFNISALFCQPDKPVGRKQELTPPITKKWALENNQKIKIYQPQTLKNSESTQILKELKPDFIVVAAYGQILPKEILDIAPCINLHASILPSYRGASPVHESILHDDEYAGVSAMWMNEGLDTGDMLGFSFVKRQNEDILELTNALAGLAGELCIKVLKKFDSIKVLPQDDGLATLCKKIKKQDGQIEFKCAKGIYLRYLAFKSWPEIYTHDGLKLKKIKLDSKEGEYRAGEIVEIQKEWVVVGCKKGKLKVYEVQPAGKNRMGVVDYLRGKRLGLGDTLV